MSAQVLSKLGEGILAEAEAEAKRKIEEAEKQVKDIIGKAEAQAAKEAEAVKVKEHENVRLAERRRLSEYSRQASIQTLTEKSILLEKTFDKALEQLKEIREGELYFKGLTRIIENSAPLIGSESVVVKLNRKDFKRFAGRLATVNVPNVKLTVDSKPIETVGGCILTSPDGLVKIDETFETRLKAAEKKLRKDVANILFAD